MSRVHWRARLPWLCLVGSMVLPVPGAAKVLRYGLVVGVNAPARNVAPRDLEELTYAEAEARRVRQALVELGAFQNDGRHAVLRTGDDATAVGIQGAALALSASLIAERAGLPDAETLFVLYVTGHGRGGRLWLRDGPVSGEFLRDLVRRVGADVSIVVLDTCESGALVAKGGGLEAAAPTAIELPDDALDMSGTHWISSSGPDEKAYESLLDFRGSVYTHFFLEGMQNAPRQAPAGTFAEIHEYAAKRTREFVSTKGLRQTPTSRASIVTRGGRPLYFSFPPRDALLHFAPDVTGRFQIEYGEGSLTEYVDRVPGAPNRDVAVFSGPLRITYLSGARPVPLESVVLLPGAKHLVAGRPPQPGLGETVRLRPKGVAVAEPLPYTLYQATTVPGAVAYLGVGAAVGYVPRNLLLPQYKAGLDLRLYYGGLQFGLDVGWGTDRQSHPSWGYRLHALGLDLSAGYGFDVWALRLFAAGSLGTDCVWQRYDDSNDTRPPDWTVRPGLLTGLAFPTKGPFSVELAFRVGPAYGRQSDRDGGYRWNVWFDGALKLRARLNGGSGS